MPHDSIRALARHARRAFPRRPYTDDAAVAHLRRGYVRARVILGDRWILAQQIARKAHEKRDAAVVAVAVFGVAPMVAADLVARLA